MSHLRCGAHATPAPWRWSLTPNARMLECSDAERQGRLIVRPQLGWSAIRIARRPAGSAQFHVKRHMCRGSMTHRTSKVRPQGGEVNRRFYSLAQFPDDVRKRQAGGRLAWLRRINLQRPPGLIQTRHAAKVASAGALNRTPGLGRCGRATPPRARRSVQHGAEPLPVERFCDAFVAYRLSRVYRLLRCVQSATASGTGLNHSARGESCTCGWKSTGVRRFHVKHRPCRAKDLGGERSMPPGRRAAGWSDERKRPPSEWTCAGRRGRLSSLERLRISVNNSFWRSN